MYLENTPLTENGAKKSMASTRIFSEVREKYIYPRFSAFCYFLCPKMSDILLLRRLSGRSRLLLEIKPTILKSTTQLKYRTYFLAEV